MVKDSNQLFNVLVTSPEDSLCFKHSGPVNEIRT